MTITDALNEVLDTIDETVERPQRPAPFVTALPASILFADTTYQRDLDVLRVETMADQFDPTLLGVLEVSARDDGRYAILDGQHRWAATLDGHPDRDGAHLVCQVHRGLTVKDEARVFYEIDVHRRSLSGWDRWKARRGAGDTVVLQIEELVASLGLTISYRHMDGAITSTATLQKIWKGAGPVLLSNVLTVLKAAYGTVSDAFDSKLMEAVAIIYESYESDEIDFARLIDRLQAMPPRQVKARAAALREVHNAELPRLCAAVMIERYNTGKGSKIEDLLSRAPAGSKLLNKTGRRSRQLAAIRRWANRNGIYCSDRSRIARSTLDAYKAEHPGFELAAS